MRFLFLFSFLIVSAITKAETCSNNFTTQLVNIPVGFNYSPNLPLKSMIGEFTGTRTPVAPCTSIAGVTREEVFITAQGIYGQKIGNDWVFTNNKYESIGYAFGGYVEGCGKTVWVTSGTWSASACVRTGSAIKNTVYFTPVVRLYNLAYLGSSTTVPQRVVGYVTRILNNTSYTGPQFSTNTSNIISSACTVSQNTVSVNMGTVEKRLFSGVGSTAGNAQNFNISLTCNRVANASVTISGSANDATKGLLNITSGSKSAKGIAIQILKNNQIFRLNSAISIGKTVSGNYSIPFKARYYQIGDITPGSANGIATFTVTYQ